LDRERSADEIEMVRLALEDLSLYSMKCADSLSNKNSVLHKRMLEVNQVSDQMLKVGHYPTIACLDRLKQAVKECWLDDLTTNVIDFKKILKEYES